VTVDDDQLAHAVDQLVDHVGHWSPVQWRQLDRAGERSRAQLVHALAQRLADLTAGAVGGPARRVPRLDSDLALPDQIRVLALDLLALPAGPEERAAALAAVTSVRHHL
jgi:hypothetical protein